jgi:hypothetical protein
LRRLFGEATATIAMDVGTRQNNVDSMFIDPA